MRISYRTCLTRGVAPIFKVCQLDSSELSKAAAGELHALVQSSGLLNAALTQVRPLSDYTGGIWTLKGEADGRVYEARLAKGASQPATPALERLLTFLSPYLRREDPG